MIGINFERHSMAAATANKGKNRVRGKGHPTTAEMNYSGAELEFMEAIQLWKRKHQKQFPTWAEVLAVLKGLGYAKPEGVKNESFTF